MSFILSPHHLRKADRQLIQCEFLGDIVRQFNPCKVNPAARDPFDSLISSIVAQQLSVKAAATINGRLRKIGGTPFSVSRLLKASPQQLRDCGLSGRKVEYVQGIAEAVKTKSLDFDALRSSELTHALETLTELRGVGQWTAEMFLMFSIGHSDIYSAQDVGLQRAMKKLFGEQADTPQAMTTLAKRWAPYRTVACWYLWRSIE